MTPSSLDRKARREQVYAILGLVCFGLFCLMTGKFWIHRRETHEIEVQEAVRASVDRFLDAMSRGDIPGAEAETTGLPAGDVERARRGATYIWGRGWTVGTVCRAAKKGEVTTVDGEVAGLDGQVSAYTASLRHEKGWKICRFETKDGVLLPLPAVVEAPDAVPILNVRIVKIEPKEQVWWVGVEIDLLAPAVGIGERWWKYSVSLRARIQDPHGKKTDAGGCTYAWEDDPALRGRKMLTYDFAIERTRGSGKYRVTLVAEARSGHLTSREIDLEIP